MLSGKRRISWLKAARKDFDSFPSEVQVDIARHRGDAYRVVYAVQIGVEVWVIHSFQKKSKSGIKTPKLEVELIHERLKRLKGML